jgi:ABC-type amino acid transport system permease subunit
MIKEDKEKEFDVIDSILYCIVGLLISYCVFSTSFGAVIFLMSWAGNWIINGIYDGSVGSMNGIPTWALGLMFLVLSFMSIERFVFLLQHAEKQKWNQKC